MHRTREERAELVTAYLASGQSQRDFALEHDLSYSTLSAWVREFHGPRRAARPPLRRFTPDERREAVEQWAKSGLSAADLAKLWGCSPSSLHKWRRRYREGGPQALEDCAHPKGRRTEQPRRLPDAVSATILTVHEAHPEFGVPRLAQHLARFEG